MKNFLAFSAFLCATASTVIAQQTLFFGSPNPANGRFSNNISWPANNNFFFEIGSFSVGFTPTSSNVANWSSNWTIANQGSQTGVTTWISDSGDTSFAGAGVISNLSGAFVANARLYIWGYDSKANGQREWVLFTNSSWVVPPDITNPGSSFIQLSDLNTTAVVGSISMMGVTLQSAAIDTSVIPEPSSFAAFAGLAMLGAASVRRRKRSA